MTMAAIDTSRERLRRIETCRSSAAVQLIALVTVFIALPILFYAVVRAWETERAVARDQVTTMQIALVAKGIAPILEQATPADAGDLTNALARYAGKDLGLALIFRPPAAQPASGVFFIARVPTLGPEALKVETARLQRAGLFAQFIERCDEADPRSFAAFAQGPMLTTVTRVRGANGCWGLVSVATAPAGAPLWSHPALRTIGFVYAAMVLLALASAVRLLTTLNRLREEASVEEKRLWLEPDSPAVPPPPPPPPPIPAPIPSAPIPAPEATAPSDGPPDVSGLLDPAREFVDLSQIVRSYLEAARQKIGDAPGRLAQEIQDAIVIRGRADFVGTILAELVGGPLSEGAAANVTLTFAKDEARRRALLTVALRGLSPASTEMGLLPPIKQFVAALGAVSAETREREGVTVRVAFPA